MGIAVLLRRLVSYLDVLLKPLKTLAHIINRVIVYRHILLNDRDYDFIYLLKIMKTKLALLRKNMEEDPFHNMKKEIKELRVCEHLLDRLIKNEYSDYYYDIFEEKWGSWKINRTKDWNYETKEYKEYRRELTAISEIEHKLFKQDLELLFSIMKRKIRCWWT